MAVEGPAEPRRVECPVCEYDTIVADEPPTGLACPECISDVETELTWISGIGKRKAETLRAHGYESIEDIRSAHQVELNKVPGIGNALAARIKADAKKDVHSVGWIGPTLQEVNDAD